LSSKLERRVAGAITLKTHVERKRETPVVPVGKGKAVFGEDDDPSSRKKAMKHFGDGSLVTLPLSGRLVEGLRPCLLSSKTFVRACLPVFVFIHPGLWVVMTINYMMFLVLF
ncbi:hypothetical protein A2U01_0057774, partial [Trifolium medium]|nr:hypothetical protein [Trifolium medium]